MKDAMARQMCPADVAEVNFLSYKDECLPVKTTKVTTWEHTLLTRTP